MDHSFLEAYLECKKSYAWPSLAFKIWFPPKNEKDSSNQRWSQKKILDQQTRTQGKKKMNEHINIYYGPAWFWVFMKFSAKILWAPLVNFFRYYLLLLQLLLLKSIRKVKLI